MREVLDVVMRSNSFGTHVDQWDLLLVGLHSIRALKNHPSIVKSSFKSVNMLFSARLGINLWLKKIEDMLVRGAKFQDEGVITPRILLPDWYTNWPTRRIQDALDIVDAGSGWHDVDMLDKLMKATGMSVSDVAAYQTCYFVEKDDPTGAVKFYSTQPMRQLNPNASLRSFMLHPPGKKGYELFQHMCRHRSRKVLEVKRTYDLPVIDHLDLAVDARVEMRGSRHVLVSDQLRILHPTATELTEGAIMKEVGTKTASVKMPKRILNTLGEVNAYSCFANDTERLQKLTSIAELASSIDTIKGIAREEKDSKALKKEEELKRVHAPKGLQRLQSGEDIESLTLSQLHAVAVVYMHTTLKTNLKQQSCVDAFKTLVDSTG